MTLPKLLIVDDSPIVLETLPDVLGDAFEVHTSDNPMLLAATLRKTRFDLLLLDVDMPALSGPQALSVLKRSDYLTHTRVVLYTARPRETLGQLASESGAADAVSKDLTHPQLIARLTQVLSRPGAPKAPAPARVETRALVFARPPLADQVVADLQALGVAAEAQGALGVDRLVRASDAGLVVFEAAAFDDLRVVLARMRRRGAISGKRILVLGDCPGEVCVPTESLTRASLEGGLNRSLSESLA